MDEFEIIGPPPGNLIQAHWARKYTSPSPCPDPADPEGPKKTLYKQYTISDYNPYSVLRLFTGLASEACTVSTLIVPNAIPNADSPARGNIHQLIAMR